MKGYSRIGDFYILEGEERLIKHILPDKYIGQNLSQIGSDYLLRFLQNELNDLLHSFVNGGFSYKGYFLFPFAADISKSNIKRINKLREIAAFLNDNGYDFSNSAKMHDNDAKKSIGFAAILSSLYRDFSSVKSKNAKHLKKPKCMEFGAKGYKKNDLEYLRPLFELKGYAGRNLRQYLAGFYLHGSFATRDYIKGWSDADTLAIVSKETIDEPKKLLELRKGMFYMRHFLCRMDPLQHHGSIVISEHDLQNYCNVYFPVEIFKYAKSFFRDEVMDVKLRGHSQEALAKLFWFVNYFRKLKIEKRHNMGSYEAKNLLHCITLFPTIYLNAKNIFVYKKFSFGIARKDLRRNWKVIDEASAIRRNWGGFGKVPFLDFASRVNPLLAYQLNSKIMGLFRKTDISIKNLVSGMFDLSEEAWLRIKQNVKTEI
ncbi:hypothetical protein HYX07_01215 [Candidatus Woesearchaeota archaeon]|nr:hypothetical protein [Candidatus Woesearchaeota archaeon]